MKGHYLYVDTGYECTKDRFKPGEYQDRFVENTKKFITNGTVVHIDNMIRKDEKEVVEQILKYFGEYHDMTYCETYGSQCLPNETQCWQEDNDCICGKADCACPNETHCYDLKCEKHKQQPYYNSVLISDDNDNFPGRMDGYTSTNPLFKLPIDEPVNLLNILKTCKEIGWCHIWIDQDQLKDMKLKTFQINDNIKFSYLWVDAESG